MSKLKVVLADNHCVLRDGLTILINAQTNMTVIAQASDGSTALQHVLDWQPDITIMDISMPGMSGIEASAAIIAEQPDAHILILSRHMALGYVRQALQAGAHGYMLKQSAATDILQAIRTIVSGNIYIDPAIAGRMVVYLSEHDQQSNGQVLSKREEQVVRLIAQGYSNKEIATTMELSVKTIDTYKIRAMDKLALYSRAALVRYALHQGWLDADI